MKNFNETELIEKLKKIEEITDSKDVDDMFYCFSALCSLGQSDKAFAFLEQHKNEMLAQPERLIEEHIFELLLLDKYDEAREAMREYEELPYISQSVEETIRTCNGLISKREKDFYKRNRPVDLDKLEEELLSDDTVSVQVAITHLADYDITKYIPTLSKVLVNANINGATRRLALILLQDREYSKKIKFLYEESSEIIDVIPSELGVAIDPNGTKKFADRLCALRNVTVEEHFKIVYEMFTLFTYPKKITYSDNDIFYGVLLAVYESFGMDSEEIVDEILASKIDLKTVLEIKSKAKTYSSSFSIY